jgi:hypothetical protein
VIPVIAIGFVLLAGLLLWFVIGSRGAWWVKLGAIVVASTFTFAVWDALGSFSGWPTEQDLPSRSLLLSSSVDEPKAIYVWVIPPSPSGVLAYKADTSEPRAYRLPYSRQLHEQLDRGTAMGTQGRPVELRRAGANTSGRRTRFVVRAYRMPHSSLSRKESGAPVLGAATSGTQTRP